MDVVDRVDVIPLRVPYPAARRFGRHVLTHGDNVFVRVVTRDGVEGYGEAIPRPYVYGESQVSIVHAIQEWLAPALVGRSPFAVDEFRNAWEQYAFNWAAKAGLDMALADIRARTCGLPLYRYLGGSSGRVELSWVLTYDKPEAMAEQAARWTERGFRSFKVKVGEDVGHDALVLRALRGAVGDAAHIYGDANEVWDLGRAAARMDQLLDYGVAMIEDPIAASAYAERRALATWSRLPILADESAKTGEEVWTELSAGGASVFNLKIFRFGIVGGLDAVSAVTAAHRTVMTGGQGETGLGAMIASHFAASSAQASALPAEVSQSLAHERSVVAGGLPFRDGGIDLPDKPGIGVELDPDVLDDMAAALWSLSQTSSGWHTLVTSD